MLDHNARARDTVGFMREPRRENGSVIMRGTLSGDASLDWLRTRMSDGTFDSVSIAFSVPRNGWRDATDASGARVRTAVGAQFRHVAIVTEPADEAARIRSAEEDDDDDDSDVRRDVNRRIRSLGRDLGLSREAVDQAIDDGLSFDEFRASARRRDTTVLDTTHNRQTLDNPDAYRRAATDAVVARMGGAEAAGAARELQGLSWADFHRRHLRQAGLSVAGLSDTEVITRALTTSDMPIIAGAAVNIRIRQTYDAAVSPIASVFGARDLPDFRPLTEALVDWTTSASARSTNWASFKSSYVTESGESYSLYTIGGITGVSRPLWINGAGAIRNLSDGQGRRLAADVSDRMVAFLTQNTLAGPDLSDHAPVFSAGPAGRGNVLGLDTHDLTTVIDGILAARAAAARRVGAGNVHDRGRPSIWIVAPEFEPTAIRALAQVAAAEVANVNPLAGRLTIVSEPRLTDEDTSYLLAPPATMDGAVQGFAFRRSRSDDRKPMGLRGRRGAVQDQARLRARLDRVALVDAPRSCSGDAMSDIATLKAQLEALKRKRASGSLRVRIGDREVYYGSTRICARRSKACNTKSTRSKNPHKGFVVVNSKRAGNPSLTTERIYTYEPDLSSARRHSHAHRAGRCQ